MNDVPSDDTNQPDDSDKPVDPLQQFLAQFGLTGQPTGAGGMDLQALMAQLQQVFGGQFGAGAGSLFTAGGSAGAGFGAGFGATPGTNALDWQQARTATRHLSATKGADPSPTTTQHRALADTARLAELWLDQVCEFAAVPATPQVWSRAEWIEQTLDSWKPIVEPIASSLGEAMAALLATDDSADAETDPMAGLATMFAPMLRQMAAGMYTMQFSQALAALSTQVVSGSEIGVQLLSQPRVVMLQSNIDTLFGDLDLPSDDVTLYLTLREAARQRLFNAVGWLAPQLLALIEHYARETRIDRSAIEQAIDLDDLQGLSAEKLQQLSSDLQGKLFEPTQTDEQLSVLQRLETLLALTEGWVDHVVAKAAAQWMPQHEALAEVVRRRRSTGGPTERVFQSLVGLELRPRRVRDAQNLWAAIDAARGPVERDRLWSHPDLLPTSSDLDDPMGFAAGEREPEQAVPGLPDDLDAELAKLLEQERGEGDSRGV